TEPRREVFRSAARRWERVIIGNLPAVGDIDDLRIDASIVEIDGPGGILGQAGPDGLRSGSSLPFEGTMEFDTDDVADLEADGSFGDVILHEMGHVLGVGTIW